MLDLVVKIGGSILASTRSYLEVSERIAGIVEGGLTPFIVVSAMRGATDGLLKACSGDRESLDRVIQGYLDVARELQGPPFRVLNDMFTSLERALKGAGFKCDRSLTDYIVSFGEVASKVLLVHSLENLGVNVMPLNAVDLVVTDGVHGDARIDYEVTMLNLLKVAGYAGSSKVTPVMEGFIGRGLGGSVVTLGRGGSDYTAVTVAALLGVPEAHLVTDVPGLMSIDPSISPKARVVKALDYSEAVEASTHGVKRINPKTFEPVSLGLGRPRVTVGSWSSRGTVIGDGVGGWRVGAKIVTLDPRDQGVVVVVGRGVGGRGFLLKLLSMLDDDVILEVVASRDKPSLKIRTSRELSVEVARFIHDVVIGGEGLEV